MAKDKTISMMILALVAIIAVIGIVMVFKEGAAPGRAITRPTYTTINEPLPSSQVNIIVAQPAASQPAYVPPQQPGGEPEQPKPPVMAKLDWKRILQDMLDLDNADKITAALPSGNTVVLTTSILASYYQTTATITGNPTSVTITFPSAKKDPKMLSMAKRISYQYQTGKLPFAKTGEEGADKTDLSTGRLRQKIVLAVRVKTDEELMREAFGGI